MLLAVFSARAGKTNQASFPVDLRPLQTTDLIAPAHGQDQQANDLAIFIVGCTLPHRNQIVIRRFLASLNQGALALLTLALAVRALHGIGVTDAFPDRPGEERGKVCP